MTLAAWHVRRLGGSVVNDGVDRWLSLPTALEELVPRFTQISAFADREEWRRIAGWLGDVELAIPNDITSSARCRRRHELAIAALVAANPRDCGEPAPRAADPPDAMLSDDPGMPSSITEAVSTMLGGALRGGSHVASAAPWLGWLAVSIVRFRERQRWLARHLGASNIESGREIDEELAALPGWRLHASGHFVTGRCPATGEEVRLAINHGLYEGPRVVTPDTVVAYDVAAWIHSLVVGGGREAAHRGWLARECPELFEPREVAAQLPEGRTWRWIPSLEFISDLIKLLGETPLLVADHGRSAFQLGPVLDAHALAIVAESFDMPEVATRWATHLGDPEVREARTPCDREEMISAHKEWIQRLMRMRWYGKQSLLPLLALHLEPAELIWTCGTLLESEDCFHEHVLEFLRRRRKLPASRAIARYLVALPVESLYLQRARLAIEYLRDYKLDHELATERFLAFSALAYTQARSNAAPFYYRAYVQLALDSFPGHALALVRQALRLDDAATVGDVAAALVAMDSPWCARELDAAYRDRAPHLEVLREALGLVRHRPRDVPRFIGKGELVSQAAWYRDHWPRWYPPRFDDDDAERLR